MGQEQASMMVAFMCQAGEAPVGAGDPAATRAVENSMAAIPRENFFITTPQIVWLDSMPDRPAPRRRREELTAINSPASSILTVPGGASCLVILWACGDPGCCR